MVKDFTKFLAIPSQPPENKRILSHMIDLARASQKFLLPEGGRLYDDPEYRALDETQPLRLPFPFIALEYHRPRPDFMSAGDVWPTKALMFARERDEAIVVSIAIWNDATGCWGPMPEASIPRVGFLDRSVRRVLGPGYDGEVKALVPMRIWKADRRIPDSDYAQELGSLLCFLNVLQCGNVHVEKSGGSTVRRSMATRKALPFDDYHILTIESPKAAASDGGHGGSHRSPREHLRRGHIRRLEDGRKLWINATVVNAGVGGKVSKDYRIAGGGRDA